MAFKKRIKPSPLTSIFLGTKMKNLWFFIAIMIPNFISALLEGGSFAFILLAFSQFTGGGDVFSSLKVPLVERWIKDISFSTQFQAFISWILVAVVLQVIRSLLSFFTAYVTSNLSLKLQAAAQTRVYTQILRLTFPCVSRYRLGDLAEYAKTPSTFIPPLMDALNRAINSILMALAALYLMVGISPSLTLITLCLFAGFGFSQKRLIGKIIRNSTRLSEHMADLGKLTIQTLESLRLIHTYHRHNKVLRDVSIVLDDISLTSKKLHFWNSSIPSINESIGILSIGSILIASLFIFDSHHVHGISLLFTFLVLAYRGSTKIQISIGALATMAVYVGPILRLREILKDEDKEYQNMSGRPFQKLSDAIEFKSVTLRYSNSLASAVSDLSFKIPRGSVTAIVGPSGGGKSSILDMLIRLYEPTEGKILIDGEPLTEYEISGWRHALGVVSQESSIFNDTVEENIRFGMDHVSQKDVVEAAKLAGAHEFILRLGEGYQTKLGERGYKLSGGELQRLSLARALLKNPQILILDEATSNLDSMTEHIVQRTIEQYCRDRTVLIIAHRLSTIAFADQVLYIENGALLESGTHEELIAKDKKYSRLWKMQSKLAYETKDHACPL